MKDIPTSIKAFLAIVFILILLKPYLSDYVMKEESTDLKEAITADILSSVEESTDIVNFNSIDCTRIGEGSTCVAEIDYAVALHDLRFYLDSYIIDNRAKVSEVESRLNRRSFVQDSAYYVDIFLKNKELTIRVKNINQ